MKFRLTAMDGFIARRAADPRYTNERRVTGPSGPGSRWYLANSSATVTHHTFAEYGNKSAETHKMTPHKDDSPKKSRKLKRKKGSEEFTESQKKELRNRDSSDNSDSGGCW